jgi:hypothetical protein
MSTTVTIPISSLKRWKSPSSQESQHGRIAPEPFSLPDREVLERLKQIRVHLKSLDNCHDIHQELFPQLDIADATDFSTDVSIENLQDLWSRGQLKETPEQTATVDKALQDMLDNENMFQEEKVRELLLRWYRKKDIEFL